MRSTLANAARLVAWSGLGLGLALAGTVRAAEPQGSAVRAPEAATRSNTMRLDEMTRRLDLQEAEIARLRAELDRPKTRPEAFAMCMQAARGQTSAMAAESVGEHCDKLLKP